MEIHEAKRFVKIPKQKNLSDRYAGRGRPKKVDYDYTEEGMKVSVLGKKCFIPVYDSDD